MKKEIKFSLLYRDMWQSSGKYVPRVDQLLKVAPHIVEMGCFARVETNGGGFEQINLLFGENPNKAVREWTQPFNDAGIQTHMLERALNGIRMNPCPADIRKLMYKVKKAQGTDIARSFCGLNDPRNIIDSIAYAKEGGMISQACLAITYSEVHTIEYYVDLANRLIEAGADEICLKDMAGVARPAWLGRIVRQIKEQHPNIVMQYHGHSGPGFSMATILEVARAGVEYIDVAMEPLSWGTGHSDLLAVHAMLKDDGSFILPEINMDAYMQVRRLTTEFIEDFLGYYINPKNRYMNSLLIGPGLPGGMMGSLMADLEINLKSLNKWLIKNNIKTLTLDELLVKLFNEVEYIWPKVGYPPLVTPYSQYVKNLALMNVSQLEKGKERWTMIADNIWDMLLGKSGQLPGELDMELAELARTQKREFFTETPQSLYPDQLPVFEKEMEDNGWERGQDDEELFELAMHPQQYRAYKSGEAKVAFTKDLAEKRITGAGVIKVKKKDKSHDTTPVAFSSAPSSMRINVNGESFNVSVSYPETASSTPPSQHKSNVVQQASTPMPAANQSAQEVLAPLEGKFYLTKDNSETPIKVGDDVKDGQVVGYIEAMKTFNAITAVCTGKVLAIHKSNGDAVEEDDVLISIA
ncbi:MAG: biotin/lipoyl-containing protein [Bacteroidales bacterium]